MAVTWTDNLHDTSKIRTSPNTRKRILHYTDEGFIKANPIIEKDFETTSEIDDWFDTISGPWALPSGSQYSAENPPYPLSNDKAMWVHVKGLDSLVYFSHTGDGGWQNGEISVYIYASGFQQNQVIYFTTNIQFDDGSVTEVGLKIVGSLAGRPAIWCLRNPGLLWPGMTGDWVASGLTYPTNNCWIKLTMAYNQETKKLTYSLFTAETSTDETSDITIIMEHARIGDSLTLAMDNDNASDLDVYIDSLQFKTYIEQDDDDTNYPSHQHEFETINITPSNLDFWRKITLEKSGQSLTSRKMITCSVLDADSGDVITGYENLVDDEINIKDITEESIRLLIKFWNWLGEESPELTKITVEYEVTSGDGNVSLACIANTYNSDITPPILTKTGYRITFEATAEEHEDPDVEITHYWFDFGDGMNTGWITHNVVNHIYTKHSMNTGEAGSDQEWNARVKVKYSNNAESSWSDYVDVMVLNEKPQARLWVKPVVCRMSGASPVANLSFYGMESFDIDDNGTIRASGGYKFDYGDGTPEAWQDANYATHEYTVEGTYVVGLTVRDDMDEESDKITTKIYIKPQLTPTTISFNKKPRQASITVEAPVSKEFTLAGGFPEVEPMYQKNRTIKIEGQAHEVETDINLLQGYIESYTLVKFQYEDVTGTTKDFVGYILRFSMTRSGGFYKYVPWSMDLQYVEI